MNIVIIGAGAIGKHIARILSKEQINVTLVDKDPKRLVGVAQTMDVAIRHGDGTDWRLLDDLLESSPDLLLAVTNDDECNLVSCAIAKNMGYPRTVARVHNSLYLNRFRVDFGRIFEVDQFINPELLAANDIYKFLSIPGSLAVETFAHGAVQLRTLTVPARWRKGNRLLRDLELPQGMIVGLIRREVAAERGKQRKLIFPHGNDTLLPGDEVTVIGEADVVSDAHLFFGSEQSMANSVVIVGGSAIALNLARILEQHDVEVRVIEKDLDICASLAEQLPRSLIIHHDGTDIDLLLREKVDKADVVVACTNRDEVNLTVALLAKEAGCDQAVMVLTDERLIPLVEKLDIAYTASPRTSAASRILSLAHAQTLCSVMSLYEHQAEVVEINVSMDSKVVGIPISDLGPQFPKDFLFAIIQNRGRIMVANGDRIISPGDTVIVVTTPKHFRELEKVF